MAAISYKCPNCGGELIFDPASQEYKCEYCVSHFNQEELDKANPKKESEKAGERAAAEENDAVAYSCPSCGAQIVTDETTAATFCYYCHNPVVLQGKLSGSHMPDKVLPFKINKEDAREAFLEFVKKKKFVPRAFFSKEQIEMLSGVYFPYWLCDTKVDGQMDAKATNVRVWRMGDTEYTETRFYEINRAGSIQFQELTRNALKKANRQLVEGVQPFQFGECKDFHMAYLSGFQAEIKDMERREFEEEVAQELKNYTTDLMRGSISGYATVTPKKTDVQIREAHWSYVLLPVWVLTYQGKNQKTYYYTMNGQSKKVFGELPVDYTKVAMLFAAIAVPVFLIFLLGGYFL